MLNGTGIAPKGRKCSTPDARRGALFGTEAIVPLIVITLPAFAQAQDLVRSRRQHKTKPDHSRRPHQRHFCRGRIFLLAECVNGQVWCVNGGLTFRD